MRLVHGHSSPGIETQGHDKPGLTPFLLRMHAAFAFSQWRSDRVAAASIDGGPTGGRGPPTVLFYFKSEGRGPDLRK